MAGERPWSVAQRIAFRFGFVLGIAFVFPFPLGYIPKTDFLADYAAKPLEWLGVWVAETIFGVTDVFTGPTGSGDTTLAWSQWFAFAMIAALVTAVWSVLDRERRAYPRLAAASLVMLRYVLGFTLLSYGLVKLVPAQFPAMDAVRLEEHIGEQSPMGMLWNFMGSSSHYEMFAGLCEIAGGVLLFWRRTSTLGALVSAGVLTNVVMLNYEYDVPVKLYSSQLLVIALVIASPQLKRIATSLLGGAVEAVPPRERSTPGRERARLALKAAVLLSLAITLGLQARDNLERLAQATGELDGIYAVESPRGSATTWTRVAVTPYVITVRQTDDTRVFYGYADYEHPPTAATKELVLADKTGKPMPPIAIAHPDATHIVLDGADGLHAVLRKLPEPGLVTRDFHWIQEYPFNR